jgi:tryptophan-rich sensory protein
MSVVDPSLVSPPVVAAPTASVAGRHVPWTDVVVGVGLVTLIAVRLAAVDATAWGWYESLRRPSWAVAMPVLLGFGWFVVVVSSSAAAWLATRRSDQQALVVPWVIQAALLAAWVWLLFWNGSIVRALAVSFLLVVAASVTTAGFLRTSRAAGALMIPALVWSALALAITGGLAVLN